jgi:hypothetical protein
VKVTRTQLRDLILESLTNEQIKKSGEADLTVKAMGGDVQGSAVAVMGGEFDKIQRMLSLRSKPSQYFVWKDSDTSVDGLYKLGAFQGNKGDPYTYDKVSGSMYRVISGPMRGAIGKTFRPKTTPKKLPAVEDDKALAKATSRDAGPGMEPGMPAGTAAPKSSRPSRPRAYKGTKEQVMEFGETLLQRRTGVKSSVVSTILRDLEAGKINKDQALPDLYRQANAAEREQWKQMIR